MKAAQEGVYHGWGGKGGHISTSLSISVVPIFVTLESETCLWGWGAGGVVVALDARPRRGLGAHAHLISQNPACSADPSQAGFSAWL